MKQNLGKQESIEKLFGAANTAQLQSSWGQTYFHAKMRSKENLDLLCNVGEIDDLLSADAFIAEDMRVLRQQVSVSPEEYTYVGAARAANNVVDKNLLEALFNNGCTIIFQSIHKRIPKLASIRRFLAADFACNVWVNGYLTQSGRESFGMHRDGHHVVVAQISGRKTWLLKIKSRSGSYDVKLEMEPGDLLYMPPSMLHNPIAHDGGSFHLTIGIDTKDFPAVANAVIEILELEDAVPENEVFVEDVGRQCNPLNGIDWKRVKRSVSKGYADLGSPGFLYRNISSSLLTSTTYVYAGDMVSIQTRTEGFHLQIDGTNVVISMSKKALPIVKRLLSGETLQVNELFGGLFDDKSVLEIARTLVRAGLLLVSENEQDDSCDED